MTGPGQPDGSILQKAVGKCLETVVQLNGTDAKCLLDTGAQVSTVVESFFRKHLAGGDNLANIDSYLRIYAANGEGIPFLGYAVAGGKPVLVPAGSLLVIECSMQPAKTPYIGVVEQNLGVVLPRGLKLGPTCVTVNKSGRIPVQVGNFSDTDIYVQPRVPIGVVNPSVPKPNVDVVQVGACSVEVRIGGQEKLQTAGIDELLPRMEFGDSLNELPNIRQPSARLRMILDIAI